MVKIQSVLKYFYVLLLCILVSDVFAQKEVFNSGIVRFDSGEYNLAVKSFSQCIKNDYRVNDALYNRSLCYYWLDEYKKSNRDLKKAMKSGDAWYLYSGISDNYIQLGKYDEAVSYIERGLETCPPNDSLYFSASILYLDYLQDTATALTYLNRSIELNSIDAEYWNERGMIYQDRQEFGKAFSDYKKVVELDSAYEYIWYNILTSSFYWAGYDTARYYVEEAVSRYPRDTAILELAGYIYLYEFMPDKAYPFLSKVYEYDSSYSEINYYMGNYHSQKEEYSKAIHYYDRALSLHPDDVYSWQERADAKFWLEDYSGAYIDYERTVELDGTNAESWYYLGYIDYYRGDYLLAEECYDTAIRYDKTNSQYYRYKGYLYEAIEDYDKACLEWGKAAGLGDREAKKIFYEECGELEKSNDVFHPNY